MTNEEVTTLLEDMLADPQEFLNKLLLLQADLENARRYIRHQENYLRDLEETKRDYDKLVPIVKELREELIHLKKIIKEALDIADTHFYEWGERSIMVFKVLEGIVEDEEEE